MLYSRPNKARATGDEDDGLGLLDRHKRTGCESVRSLQVTMDEHRAPRVEGCTPRLTYFASAYAVVEKVRITFHTHSVIVALEFARFISMTCWTVLVLPPLLQLRRCPSIRFETQLIVLLSK